MNRFTANLESQTLQKTESRRAKFVLCTNLLALAWTFANSFFGLGPITAYAIIALEIGLNLAYICRYRDSLLGRLWLFGITAGWVELLADRWLVDGPALWSTMNGGHLYCVRPFTCPSPGH